MCHSCSGRDFQHFLSERPQTRDWQMSQVKICIWSKYTEPEPRRCYSDLWHCISFHCKLCDMFELQGNVSQEWFIQENQKIHIRCRRREMSRVMKDFILTQQILNKCRSWWGKFWVEKLSSLCADSIVLLNHFEILSLYNHIFQCILLRFYEVKQHKVGHNCEWESFQNPQSMPCYNYSCISISNVSTRFAHLETDISVHSFTAQSSWIKTMCESQFSY